METSILGTLVFFPKNSIDSGAWWATHLVSQIGHD